MPPVREPGDAPEGLEIVEVRPGVRLKLNAADKKAILAAQAAEVEQRRAWNLVNAQVADKPAKETVIAGPAVDGPVDHAPDGDEDAVVATPKKARSKAQA